jgi:hypothetical protein
MLKLRAYDCNKCKARRQGFWEGLSRRRVFRALQRKENEERPTGVYTLYLLATCECLGVVVKGKSHSPLGRHSGLW